MDLPPGKLEKNLPGGKGVLAALVDEAHDGAFNGMIHTSVYRGDDPADGVLLLRNGREILAGHLLGETATNGPDALREIARDSLHDNCVVEVRSYDYKTSHINIPQLADSFPEAKVDVAPDYGAMLAALEDEEDERRRARAKEQHESRKREQDLLAREKDLFQKKWELEKDHARTEEQAKELADLRAELARFREQSATILQQFAERR